VPENHDKVRGHRIFDLATSSAPGKLIVTMTVQHDSWQC
jgi:hypothetical protein